MKKIILLFSIVLSSACIKAQVHIIPKIGVNISNVRFDSDHDWDGLKSLVGLTTGFGFKCDLTDVVFFQPEILFSQKGFSAKTTGTVGYDVKYRLNYLEVPLLFGVKFGPDNIKGYINAGPSVGMLIGGKVKGKWNIGGFNDDIDKNIEFEEDPNPLAIQELHANRIELGANVGGGVLFSVMDNLNVFLDLRYNAGLTNFNEETNRSKNSVFAITTGLQIKFK